MEPIKRTILGAALGIMFLTGGVFGQDLPGAPGSDGQLLQPSLVALRLAAMEEPLPLATFIEAALNFSGIPAPSLQQARSKLEALARRAAQAAGGLAEPRQKAERLLIFMHDELLTEYRERQTRLDVLLEDGTFNCVSSAVLYAILAKEAGFKVWGVRTPDHAFVRVQAGEAPYDVETTSAFGFDPGSRKEFQDSFGRVTGYSYVPPSNSRQRKDIGERALLALILYNLSAFATDRRAYQEALAPAGAAYALLRDGEAYDRLLTSLLNLGSWYGMNREYPQGLTFLGEAQRQYPDARLRQFAENLIHNWAVSLIEERRLAEAEALLDSRFSAGELHAQEWRDLMVYVYQMRAQEAAKKDYAAAAEVIRLALDKVGQEPSLVGNYEAYVHNQAVTLARSSLFSEALVVLQQALRRLPGSAVLRHDEAVITEQMNRR